MSDFLEPFLMPGLWALAGLVLVWACLPPLLHVLGLTRYSQRIDPAPADLQPGDHEPDFDDAYHQLKALAVEPLGAYDERVWFFYFHWVKWFRTRVFLHREQHCYACVYRLAAGERVRVAFGTCFTDGGMVWSSNALEGQQVHEEDWVRWGFVTDDLRQLLGLHQELAGKFGSARRQPETRDDLETLLAAVGRVSRRHIHGDKALALQLFKVALAIMGVSPFLIRWLTAGSLWLVPVLVIGYGSGWMGFRMLWPRVIRAKRASEIAHRERFPVDA